MEKNDEFGKVPIKNRTCSYFVYIIKFIPYNLISQKSVITYIFSHYYANL